MSHESPQTSLKLLQSLKISSFHKLIVLSLNLPCLHNLAITLAFIWSQFQVLILLLRTSEKCLFGGESPMISIHFLEKYLFSKNLFDAFNFPQLTLTMLILAFAYLIIVTIAFLYLLYALNRRLAIPNLVLKLWKLFLDLHPLVTFYPLHLNTTQLIRNFTQENSSINSSIAIFSFIVLICNLILALALTVLFNANLKTKHPFSSKSNTLWIIDLFIKSLLPFFIQKESLPKGEKAIFMIIIALYCLFRDQNLLRILPYYRLNTLKIAITTHAITTSCIFAVLFAKIFCEARNWTQYSVTLLFWVIFAPIFIKMYTSYINNRLLRIILHPFEIRSANLLTHYWAIYKHYSKFGSTGFAASRFKQEYLDLIVISNDLAQDANWSLETQKSKRQAFFERKIEILQSFIKRYPRDSWLAELVLARLYTKRESSCVLAYHIIHKSLNRSLLDKTSLMLIQLKILSKLQSRFDLSQNQSNTKNQRESLQISNFVHLLDQYKIMKRDIVQNIDCHLKFWKIFAAPKPNFLTMLQLAKQNLASSKKLKAISKQCKDFKKFFFSEPLLSASLYYYFFQDETLLAANLLKEYFESEQYIKQAKEKAKNLTQQKVIGFSPDAVYLIVSCEQNQPGTILDCSGRISSVFGYPKDSLIGKSINVFIPPIYARYHDYFLRNSQRISSMDIMNSIRPVSLLVQEGYVRPGLIHVSLTYMQDYELCYYIVLEAIKDDTRLVLLNSNGAITSCSENFATDLGFNEFKDQDFLNIQNLCPGFFEKIQKQGKSSQQTSLVETAAGPKNNGFIQEIFSKEVPKLYFFPFWHNSPQQDTPNPQKDPIIYQTKLRKLKIQQPNSSFEIYYELKMHKISTFNFTPPASLRRATFQLSIKDLPLHSNSAKMSLDFQQPKTDSDTKSSDKIAEFVTRRNRLDTPPPQEVAFSARTTHRLISMKTPKGKRNSEFLSATTTLGMITEAPILPVSENNEEDESYTNTEDNQNTGSLSKEQMSSSSHLEKNHEGFLQEMIRKSSTTETGIGKLGSTKSVERQKIVKRLVQARTHRPETKLYIASFGAICLLLLGLLIWLNFYTSNTSKNVTTYSDALQNAYFRSYWTKIANQDTLYWLGAVTKWVDYDLGILTSGFNKSFHRMNYYNQALEKSISFISEELQEMHYEKKVRIYDRNSTNGKVLIAVDDTFQATKRIMNRGLVNFERAISGYDFEEKINQDSYFIFDNSLNDLQIQESLLITAIKDRLFSIFDDSRSTILKYMGTTFFFVFLFMVFSLKYTITTNINFKLFMTILYTLKKSEVKHVEHISSVFKELLEKDDHEKDLLFSLYDSEKLHSKEIQVETAKRNHQQNRENYFSTSLKGPLKEVYSRNLLLFLGLFVFTGLTIGFALLYYTRSSNKLNTMQKQQININSALTP